MKLYCFERGKDEDGEEEIEELDVCFVRVYFENLMNNRFRAGKRSEVWRLFWVCVCMCLCSPTASSTKNIVLVPEYTSNRKDRTTTNFGSRHAYGFFKVCFLVQEQKCHFVCSHRGFVPVLINRPEKNEKTGKDLAF